MRPSRSPRVPAATMLVSVVATLGLAGACTEPDEAIILQTISGTFTGDRTTGCTYLDGAYARWPPGLTARFDPPRLENVRGDVVARDGDRLTITGGPSGKPPPATCDGDRVVIVHSVDAVAAPR